MKNIFLLFLCISFKQIYGENTTEPATTGSDAGTTEMYTSTMVYETLPDVTGNLTAMCDYESVDQLSRGEGIDITICGYTSDDDQVMVEITLDLPQDRWVGAGFVTTEAYGKQKNRMENVYTIIVPAYSRDIQERYMVTKGDIGDRLQQTVSIAEDKYEKGMRSLTLRRKISITTDDLVGNATVTGELQPKYFDFSNFKECSSEINIIWAFAKVAKDPISYHGKFGQRGSITALIDMVMGEECADEGFRNTPLSIISILIISFIAILTN